jgi:RecG-like helicase
MARVGAGSVPIATTGCGRPPVLNLGEATMRKLIPLFAVAFLFSGLTLLQAQDKGKEKTITGEGQCAKCSLMETESCQNAIVTDEGGKKVTYLLAQNPVSKKFHSNICKTKKKVTATGTVEEKDGEMVLTASKIELAGDK